MDYQQTIRTLVILGKLDKHILFLSNTLLHGSIDINDDNDLLQDARLKILEIINKEKNKPIHEITAICYKSVKNLYINMLRNFKSKSNGIIFVDLTDAINLHSPEWITQNYMDFAMEHLYGILDDSGKIVLDVLLNYDMDFDKFMISYCEYYGKPLRITIDILSNYFGVKKHEVESVLNSIKLSINSVSLGSVNKKYLIVNE